MTWDRAKVAEKVTEIINNNVADPAVAIGRAVMFVYDVLESKRRGQSDFLLLRGALVNALGLLNGVGTPEQIRKVILDALIATNSGEVT